MPTSAYKGCYQGGVPTMGWSGEVAATAAVGTHPTHSCLALFLTTLGNIALIARQETTGFIVTVMA